MKNLISKLMIGFAAIAMFLGVMAAPVAVYAQTSIQSNVCRGVGEATDGNTSCDEDQGGANFGSIARRIINIFSIVVGAVSVIMIILGGFQYIISNGDSTKVTNAKNTIMYAIVGLIIVLFAQIIVRFVLSAATRQQ